LSRRFHELSGQLTRGYPQDGHGDFVHVYATYLAPRLLAAEARRWGSKLARSAKDVRARYWENRRGPGMVGFLVELSNHRWPWLDQNIESLLSSAVLDIDGRRFSTVAVERPFFRRMLRGQTRVIWFRAPAGEPALPGPSAKVIRLEFPGLRNRRRRSARLRNVPREKWFVPRIRFEPELFGSRWAHPEEPTSS
jgi:hypothetical protein